MCLLKGLPKNTPAAQKEVRQHCILEKTKQGTIDIVIKQGNILEEKADAIVNAANEQLLGGGGVCGAIFKAAGWQQLQQACNMFESKDGMRCPVGQARITGSFDLQKNGIKHIIHAVGPNCRNYGMTTKEDQDSVRNLLSSAYTQSLILADKQEIGSIAFPFISSAIFACPKQLAAEAAYEAIFTYIKHQPSTLKKITIVLFSTEDFELFTSVMKNFK